MTTAKARHQGQDPLRRYRVRMPGITDDLDRIVGEDGRCPRDQGLLVAASGEEGVLQKCANCGFRHYNAVGRLATKIAWERAMVEKERGEHRGAMNRTHGDRTQEGDAWESDGED